LNALSIAALFAYWVACAGFILTPHRWRWVYLAAVLIGGSGLFAAVRA
jgi:hypothetical protein